MKIEIERDADGYWVARIPDMPAATFGGASPEEALGKAKDALRTMPGAAERGGQSIGAVEGLSPAEKARLPGALQFAAALVFVLGLCGLMQMLAPIVEFLFWGGSLSLRVDVVAILYLLAAAGLFRLSKAWRMAAVVLLWLGLCLVPVMVWYAGHELAIEAASAATTSDAWFWAGFYYVLVTSALLLLLSPRAREPFGLSYDAEKMVAAASVALVSMVVAVAIGLYYQSYLR